MGLCLLSSYLRRSTSATTVEKVAELAGAWHVPTTISIADYLLKLMEQSYQAMLAPAGDETSVDVQPSRSVLARARAAKESEAKATE